MYSMIDQETARKVLATTMQENDADADTIGDYLRALLAAVLEEEEGFDGKRPFGNSGWLYEMYAALIAEGLVEGDLDEFGYVQDVDEDEAFALVSAAVGELR
jgi:hypothetical protein